MDGVRSHKYEDRSLEMGVDNGLPIIPLFERRERRILGSSQPARLAKLASSGDSERHCLIKQSWAVRWLCPCISQNPTLLLFSEHAY